MLTKIHQTFLPVIFKPGTKIVILVYKTIIENKYDIHNQRIKNYSRNLIYKHTKFYKIKRI